MLRVIFSFIIVLSTSAVAAEQAVGRYTIADTTATAEQRFSLLQTRSLDIPRAIQSNGQAISYLLRDTGYRMATNRVRSAADVLLMSKPLAAVSRTYANTRLLEILDAIAGLGFTPVIDPINRLVAFDAIYDFTN